jgi:hypothetical protein
MRRLGVAAGAAFAALLVPPAAGAAPAVTAEVSPARISVGQPFDYVVRATVDTSDQARDVRIVAPIGAFDAIGPSTLVRDGREVRLTQRVACLGPACVSTNTPRLLLLPPARATRGGTVTTAAPVEITVVPRVPAAVVRARTPAYVRQTEVPPARFAARPDLLAAVALALAAVFAVVGVVLLVSCFRPRSRLERGAADEYARAVRLLRESTERQAADRRRAAGLLGRVARPRAEALATSADRVAWSRPQPEPDVVAGLADRAERGRS